MVGDERSRTELSERLADQLGPDLASELMEVVWPAAEANAGTPSVLREQLQGQERRLGLRLSAIRDALDVELHDQAGRVVAWQVATLLALGVVAALIVTRR